MAKVGAVELGRAESEGVIAYVFGSVVATPDRTMKLPNTSTTLVDSQKPVITLLGPQVMAIPRNSVWVEPGFIATDFWTENGKKCSANISDRVTVSREINTANRKLWVLVYRCEDAAGNVAVAKRRYVYVLRKADMKFWSGSCG